MSDYTPETPTPPADSAPTETPAAKRERASYPIRLLAQTADASGYGPPIDGVSFATIEQAERWVRDSGTPSVTYMLARVIGGRRMPPSSTCSMSPPQNGTTSSSWYRARDNAWMPSTPGLYPAPQAEA